MTFASCSKDPIEMSETHIPTEVNMMIQKEQVDTVLVIKYDKKLYQFNYKTKAYKSTINIDNSWTFYDFIFIIFLIVVGMFLVFAI